MAVRPTGTASAGARRKSFVSTPTLRPPSLRLAGGRARASTRPLRPTPEASQGPPRPGWAVRRTPWPPARAAAARPCRFNEWPGPEAQSPSLPGRGQGRQADRLLGTAMTTDVPMLCESAQRFSFALAPNDSRDSACRFDKVRIPLPANLQSHRKGGFD